MSSALYLIKGLRVCAKVGINSSCSSCQSNVLG